MPKLVEGFANKIVAPEGERRQVGASWHTPEGFGAAIEGSTDARLT
jgi:hypothetical protein